MNKSTHEEHDTEHDAEIMLELARFTIEVAVVNAELAGLCPHCFLSTLGVSGLLNAMNSVVPLEEKTDEEIDRHVDHYSKMIRIIAKDRQGFKECPSHSIN